MFLGCLASAIFMAANAAAAAGELLKASSPSGYSDELAAARLQPMGDAVFFLAESSGPAIGLWKAEASTTSTTLVRDLGSKKLVLRGPLELGGRLLWVLGGPGAGTGDPRRYELWSSDGSAAGTSLVKVLGPEFGTDAELIAKAGSLLFFNAAGLWRTDGTVAGTVRLAGGGGARLSRLGQRLLFTTFDAAQGELLWITDGTVAGTRLVADIGPSNSKNRFSPDGFVEVDGIAFFGADDGVDGMQLWKTDGTGPGTRRVRKLAPMAPKSLVGFDGRLFFLRDRELWRSDGTETGTVLVAKPRSEDSRVQVGPIQAVAGHLWFGVLADGRSELWRSDGSSNRTAAVAVLADRSHEALLGEFA
ncbi:MAG: hypothetical protein JNL97_15035, partial [Verrucomicrobiales bacterium]|nr:hypothetical protein [Verrucomicrobiales bacterium]